MRYYDRKNNRLIYIGNSSDDEYWDNHWEDKDFKQKVKIGRNLLVSFYTKKYLPKESTVLEGGCGRGQNVYMLDKMGYRCIGIDYAQKTVEKVKSLVPEVDIRLGDVRKLDFDDEYFDGYWSLGVIEHFYNGYEDIINEMRRVLKPNGVLFLTVPTMSVLREKKALTHKYPLWDNKPENIKNFYQFALDPKQVIKDFEAIGFELLEMKPYDGFKGLKDEVGVLKKPMQYIYDSKNILFKVFRKVLDTMIRRYSSHMTLFVLRKK